MRLTWFGRCGTILLPGACAILGLLLALPPPALSQDIERYEGDIPAEGNRAIWITDRDTGLVRFCIGAGDDHVSAGCSEWTGEGSETPRYRPGAVQAAPAGQRFSGRVPSEGNRAIWVLDHETGFVRFCIGAIDNGIVVECSRWVQGN